MDINIIVESLPRLLKGALLTLELTGISLGLGLFLAIALAFMCVSKKKWI